jgi:hypothetical protein
VKDCRYLDMNKKCKLSHKMDFVNYGLVYTLKESTLRQRNLEVESINKQHGIIRFIKHANKTKLKTLMGKN